MNQILKIDTKGMVMVSFLIAIEIVLTRFLSIQTPIVRISFGFLPIAITAMLFGPFYAGFAAAIGDFLGVMIFPTGAYFPGFTLTAFLSGAAYGIFLFDRPKTLLRIACAVVIVTMLLDLGLNSVWLTMITGKGIYAILPVRILKTALMIPVEITAIFLFHKFPVKRLQ